MTRNDVILIHLLYRAIMTFEEGEKDIFCPLGFLFQLDPES